MKNIINILFTLFIVYLFICSAYNNINIVIICAILTFLIYFVIKKIGIKDTASRLMKTLLENQKNILIFLIISLLIRITLYIILYNNLELTKISDYITCFYDDSLNYARNLDVNRGYISMFPYLFGYIFVLGNFFKIFGTSYVNVIIMNTLFDLLGAFFAYKFMKEAFNKKQALIAFLIWTYNPFNILWSFISYPIITVNSLIMICIYVFYYLVKNLNSLKKTIIYSIVITILLGFTNSLRPIMIVFVIAIVIYFVYIYMKKHTKTYNLILSITIIMLGFDLYNSINIDFVSNSIGKKAVKNPTGWAFYVGSNFDSKGAWFEDKEFYELMRNDSVDFNEVHEIYFKKGLSNYKKNGLSNVIHFFNKSTELSGKLPRETIASIEVMLKKNGIPVVLSKILKVIMHLFYFCFLFVNLFVIKIKDEQIKEKLNFLMLLILGFYSSHLLVEVQPKYFLPIFVPLTIITTVAISEKNSNLKKEQKL